MADLHPAFQDSLEKNRQKGRDAASRDNLPKFHVGVLAISEVLAGEKLALR